MTDIQPAPLPSATVLLLRDDASGGTAHGEPEVFMVVRHHQIDFASGALVFPGGKLDAADGDPRLRTLADGAEVLSDSELAYRVCAIREAFEEAGVLLARPRGQTAVIDAARLAALQPFREILHHGEIDIADFLQREDLALAADLLVPFAHWITPVNMRRRFDTYFFLAIAPADQLAVHDGSESVDSIWTSATQALAEADAKRATVVFPTRMNLIKLGRSATAEAAIAAARVTPVVTVLPEFGRRAEGATLRIPLDAGYGVDEVLVEGIPRV